jgi:hypothetical protein
MQPFGSAVYSQAVEKAATAAYDAGKPLSNAELDTIGKEADRKATFGFDYRVDRSGAPIQQGISAENSNTNHFAALLKAEQLGRERPGTQLLQPAK